MKATTINGPERIETPWLRNTVVVSDYIRAEVLMAFCNLQPPNTVKKTPPAGSAKLVVWTIAVLHNGRWAEMTRPWFRRTLGKFQHANTNTPHDKSCSQRANPCCET